MEVYYDCINDRVTITPLIEGIIENWGKKGL